MREKFILKQLHRSIYLIILLLISLFVASVINSGKAFASTRKSLLYFYDYNEGMGQGMYEMMKQRMILLPSFSNALGSNASAITSYMTEKYEQAKDSEGNEWYFVSEGNKALFVHPVNYDLEKVTYPSEILNQNGSFSVYSIGGAGEYYANYTNQRISRSLNEYYEYGKNAGSYQYSSNVNYKQRSLFYAFGSFGNGKCSGYVVSEDSSLNYNNFDVRHEYYNCKLKEIVIPSSVKKIEAYTFINCVGLAKLTGGEEIIEVGAWAFANAPFVTELMEHSINQYSSDGDRIIDNVYRYYNGKNYSSAIGPAMNDYLKSYLTGMYNGYKPYFYFPEHITTVADYNNIFSGRGNVKLYNAGPSRIKCPYGHVYELKTKDDGCLECALIVLDIIVSPESQTVDINENPSFVVSGIYQDGKVRSIENFGNNYIKGQIGTQIVKINVNDIVKEVTVICSQRYVCAYCKRIFQTIDNYVNYCNACSSSIDKVIFECNMESIKEGQTPVFNTKVIFKSGNELDMTNDTSFSLSKINDEKMLLCLNYAGYAYQKELELEKNQEKNKMEEENYEAISEVISKTYENDNMETETCDKENMDKLIKDSIKAGEEILSFTVNELYENEQNNTENEKSKQRIKLFLRGLNLDESCRVYYNIWNDTDSFDYFFSGKGRG